MVKCDNAGQFQPRLEPKCNTSERINAGGKQKAINECAKKERKKHGQFVETARMRSRIQGLWKAERNSFIV